MHGEANYISHEDGNDFPKWYGFIHSYYVKDFVTMTTKSWSTWLMPIYYSDEYYQSSNVWKLIWSCSDIYVILVVEYV